jgi:hypothetical protein
MDHTETIDLGPQPNDPETLPDLGGEPDENATFQGELARAMQAAAERERARIARVVRDEAAAQADATRGRAAIEADELRRLADADLEHIQQWSADEVERIRTEGERRTTERKTALAEHLAQHEAIVDAEIGGLDDAVTAYDATMDAFFERLGPMTDPTEIARLAGSLPRPPDLDAARAAARSRAMRDDAGDAEPPPVGSVQDESDASPGEDRSADGIASDEAPSDSAATVAVMASDPIGRADEPADGTPPPHPEPDDPAATAAAELTDAPSAEPVSAEPTPHESAAARVLRTIAPWTSSSNGSPERNGSAD